MAWIAKTNHLGNNVSFAMVGLLWTLAETLARRGRRKAPSNSIPSMLLYGHQMPSSFLVSVADNIVRLWIHSSDEDADQIDAVVLQIFGHLRELATDSRVEVRNCSLRSLVAAYITTETTSEPSSLTDAMGLADRVGLILAGALDDVCRIYRNLTTNIATDVPNENHHNSALLHHSRDSALKLWDDSVVIILEGVSCLVLSQVFCCPKSFRTFLSLHLSSLSLL